LDVEREISLKMTKKPLQSHILAESFHHFKQIFGGSSSNFSKLVGLGDNGRKNGASEEDEDFEEEESSIQHLIQYYERSLHMNEISHDFSSNSKFSLRSKNELSLQEEDRTPSSKVDLLTKELHFITSKKLAKVDHW